MTTPTRGGHRLFAALAGLFLLTLPLAGCFGTPDDDAGDETPESFGTLDLFVAPMDPPEELEGAVLTVVVDHVAFLDADRGTWTAILSEPATLELVLEAGFGDEAWLATVPLPAGDYTDVEFVASSATLTTPDGTQETTLTDDTCYTATPFSAAEDTATETTLILDASAALDGGTGGWTFRPALVGSYSGGTDGEADIDDPYCVTSA